MTDYIKWGIEKVHAAILRERILFTSTESDPVTQELLTEVGWIENMKIEFRYKYNQLCGITISGSMHVYHNLVFKGEKQNYDDFNLESLNMALTHFESRLGINIRDAVIQNLEFGANIIVSVDPEIILSEKLISYKFKGSFVDMDYGAQGHFKEFASSQYYIKIYDKSRPYSHTINRLRVEVKYIRSQILKPFGLNSISDLYKPKVLKAITYDFIRRIEKGLLIVDTVDFGFVKDVKKRDLLKDGINPKYWKSVSNRKPIKLHPKKSYSDSWVYRRKRSFQQLLEEFRLTSLKEEIMSKLQLKMAELSILPGINERERTYYYTVI